ncbi:hypothetical protein, partial [uncultured Ruminococcus sp.]|uniref:hypothetical protein n=1 Tax=uncultured Ruminococcus sp. TaxID=165186 RepID=UPI0025D21521
MEKTRKRFLAMITAFMMLFTLVVILPEGAIKASADEVSVSTAAELKNALSDTSNRNKELKMTKDITVSESVDVSFNVALNMVGHKLTFEDGYLNVEMSSGSEVFTIIGGTLKGNHPGGIVYLKNGYIYFESGVIENTYS